jgi:hypothetical protein
VAENNKWLLGIAGAGDVERVKHLAQEFVAYLRQQGHALSFSTFHHGEATPLAGEATLEARTSPGTTVANPPPEPGKPAVHPTPPISSTGQESR